MFKVLTVSSISHVGLARLSADHYRIGNDIKEPDAILVRSTKMHHMDLPPSVKVIGRAGIGTDNIPVWKMSQRGVPVLNAPGANANAVKELVIASLILACRHVCLAWDFSRTLEASPEEFHSAIEGSKKRFSGYELTGRTLGVIGLGAIGRIVASTGAALGMKVIGHDPHLTVEGAWQLSPQVRKAHSLGELLHASDFLTLHVPLTEATRHLINAQRLTLMKEGVVILNFARAGIVDEEAILDALNIGKAFAYICDFPSISARHHPRVIALPHLGASTQEAEDNCAIMVIDQVRDFLENGNIRNSVNFPDVILPREAPHRLVCTGANRPDMEKQISKGLVEANFTIYSLVSKSRGELTYAVIDLFDLVPESVAKQITSIKGVLSVRLVEPPRLHQSRNAFRAP